MMSEQTLRLEICEIGRRLYAHGFAAGNDGNISCRLGESTVLCTPTLICKGFMKPADICTVDMDGRRLSGALKPTSEIKLHLEIYRGDPAVRAVVHCHPPHATAFGVARRDIPSGVLPEVEIFLGEVPRAEYETPGGEGFAATIRPFIGRANTVVLSNHGTVSWGPSLERAYWRTETLDAYCRILLLAGQLGNIERLPSSKVEELKELAKRFESTPDRGTLRRLPGGYEP
jgi:L-fuculose-phosphate aldolase